jgi:hypothetical protein
VKQFVLALLFLVLGVVAIAGALADPEASPPCATADKAFKQGDFDKAQKQYADLLVEGDEGKECSTAGIKKLCSHAVSLAKAGLSEASIERYVSLLSRLSAQRCARRGLKRQVQQRCAAARRVRSDAARAAARRASKALPDLDLACPTS